MFMNAEITEEQNWYSIDGTCGGTHVPADVVGTLEGLANIGDEITDDPPEFPASLRALADYYEGEIQSVELIKGFGARLSASGYLDCTDWMVCDTVDEAKEALSDQYDLCRQCLHPVAVDDDWKCPEGCDQIKEEAELQRVLARIALADHDKSCPHQYAPINECPCYNPADWAAAALGVRSYTECSENEKSKLKAIVGDS